MESKMEEVKSELEEIEKQIFALKAKRSELQRNQPRRPIETYTFQTPNGNVTLQELFGNQNDLLVVHNMGRGCAYCTLWADGFNSLVPHLTNRTAFVVLSPDAPEIQHRFATERGWTFRMVSGQESAFSRDMGFTAEDGSPYPGVTALHKQEDGTIVRVSSSWFGPGDDFCPVWPFFELLADGINNWEPEYTYTAP